MTTELSRVPRRATEIPTFSRRDGTFVVRTDGPDGTHANYDVKYTLDIAPLQQYLIEFPDGRLQARSIAWDTRPRAQGGQRWLHLYPGQNVSAGVEDARPGEVVRVRALLGHARLHTRQVYTTIRPP
jgi:hypothetical protein